MMAAQTNQMLSPKFISTKPTLIKSSKYIVNKTEQSALEKQWLSNKIIYQYLYSSFIYSYCTLIRFIIPIIYGSKVRAETGWFLFVAKEIMVIFILYHVFMLYTWCLLEF